MSLRLIIRVRISNLGWNFLPSQVALHNPYLSCLWTDLAKRMVDFWPRFKSWVYKISDILVHRECLTQLLQEINGNPNYKSGLCWLYILLLCVDNSFSAVCSTVIFYDMRDSKLLYYLTMQWIFLLRPLWNSESLITKYNAETCDA